MSAKDKLKKAREKSKQRRLKKAEKFADELKDKLGDKVCCVVVYGSVSREEHKPESDIDTFVVLDDTKLKKDVPSDAKDKIRRKVSQLAQEVDEKITIQYFLFLTEFWDAIRKGEPLIVTVLRMGIPVYDVGIFKPAKRMLERGKIYSSKEAVRKRMKLASGGYKKCEKYLKSSIPHNLEQSMANAGQAPIMMLGRTPPPKEKVPDVLEEMFVENDLLEKKYVEMARDLNQFSSKAEKGKIDVTGEVVEEHMEKANQLISRMGKLISSLGARKKVKDIVDDYKTFLKANVAALKSKGIEPPEKKDELPKVVKEQLDFDEEQLELFDRWEGVVKKLKDKELGEVNDKKLYELKSDTREFVSQVGEELKQVKEEIDTDIDPEAVAKKTRGDDSSPEESED